MVARIESSYNVLALFKTLKGDTSASTEAVDAIIEQVRKINAAASSAHMQGASVATEAWISQSETSPADDYIAVADVDLKAVRARFDSDAEYAVFTRSFEIYVKHPLIPKDTVDNLIDYAKITHMRTVGRQAFLDKAADSGSKRVYDLVKWGDSIELFASALASYNRGTVRLKDGQNYIAQKTTELANTTDAEQIKKIGEEIEIASGMISGGQQLVDNFQTYLDYMTWSWSTGIYSLSGSLYEKNEDGTYSPGVFEINVRDVKHAYWKHDGSGIALQSNPTGSEYYKVDMTYLDKQLKSSYTSVSHAVDFIRDNYSERVVVDGQARYIIKYTLTAAETEGRDLGAGAKG